MNDTTNIRHHNERLPSLDVVQHKDREYTRNETIQDLVELAETFPERRITRDFYRTHANIPEKVWTSFFGTFPEFMRQAGLNYTRIENRVRLRVGQHASVDDLRKISEERKSYGENYLRVDTKRYQTMVACSDLHDRECDPFYLRVLLETIKNVKPEIVCIDGDLFDIPEFGKYTVDPREWDTVGRIQDGLNIVRQIREVAPDAQIDLIEGNHESVSLDTEILTDEGWVLSWRIVEFSMVASFSDSGISFDKPTRISRANGVPLVNVIGDLSDELVSNNHRIYVDGKLAPVSEFLGQSINQTRFIYARSSVSRMTVSDEKRLNLLRLLVWTIMDGTIVSRQTSNRRIQFKLSKQRKIDRLVGLLREMGVPFTFSPATKSESNKLQPFYVRIYGDAARMVYDELDGKKEVPSVWSNLNVDEIRVILEEITNTDGGTSYNHIKWRTTRKSDADTIQQACIRNGIPCKIKASGKSGFTEEGKPQYVVSIFHNGVYDRRYVEIRESGIGDVISITTANDTLITRRNGKVAFTGNSRLIRHVSESSPAMRAILSDMHGFTIGKLFKLDEYEVNYVAKSDLFAFTDYQVKKETMRNYKVYWNCMIAHHFPEGKKLGLPGFHGHHHQHLSWTFHNNKMGSYEWHQLGAGHVRNASYAEGAKWNCGFMIANCDTQYESVNFDYTYVGDTMSVSGGTFYYRNEFEYYPALTQELESRKR